MELGVKGHFSRLFFFRKHCHVLFDYKLRQETIDKSRVSIPTHFLFSAGLAENEMIELTSELQVQNPCNVNQFSIC